jgi:ABC-type Fe3+-hydroxamate transport system substrate-binding protein
MPPILDALGTAHSPAGAGARIVCLVPSITELLCDLGLAAQMVGRTGYCVHPREVVKNIPKVGGTKTVNVEKIRKLAPTHLVVNVDENEKPTVDALRAFVPNVIVTHPKTPEDNFALFRLMGDVFGKQAEAQALCGALEQALAELAQACEAGELPERRVLYLIWKDPWMTISSDTYIAGMLALANLHCIEVAGAARYPAIDLPCVMQEAAHATDVVLLSSEPYRFTQVHADELQASMPGKVVRLIDGEMTSWYGSRAVQGARYLRQFAMGL